MTKFMPGFWPEKKNKEKKKTHRNKLAKATLLQTKDLAKKNWAIDKRDLYFCEWLKKYCGAHMMDWKQWHHFSSLFTYKHSALLLSFSTLQVAMIQHPLQANESRTVWEHEHSRFGHSALPASPNDRTAFAPFCRPENAMSLGGSASSIFVKTLLTLRICIGRVCSMILWPSRQLYNISQREKGNIMDSKVPW